MRKGFEISDLKIDTVAVCGFMERDRLIVKRVTACGPEVYATPLAHSREWFRDSDSHSRQGKDGWDQQWAGRHRERRGSELLPREACPAKLCREPKGAVSVPSHWAKDPHRR
jgi:hypothetical protein